jgi:hypothetical protein
VNGTGGPDAVKALRAKAGHAEFFSSQPSWLAALDAANGSWVSLMASSLPVISSASKVIGMG